MKKFYKTTGIKESDNGKYEILLDNRPIRTPLKEKLIAPNQIIAEAVRQEWESQGEDIITETMPVMQYLATVIDHVSNNIDYMQKTLMTYATNEHLTFLADRKSEEQLHAKQQTSVVPLVAKAKELWNWNFHASEDLMSERLDAETSADMEKFIKSLDIYTLSVYLLSVQLTNSLTLVRLVLEKHISEEEYIKVALLEAQHQQERWGEDPEQTKVLNKYKGDLSKYVWIGNNL